MLSLPSFIKIGVTVQELSRHKRTISKIQFIINFPRTRYLHNRCSYSFRLRLLILVFWCKYRNSQDLKYFECLASSPGISHHHHQSCKNPWRYFRRVKGVKSSFDLLVWTTVWFESTYNIDLPDRVIGNLSPVRHLRSQIFEINGVLVPLSSSWTFE